MKKPKQLKKPQLKRPLKRPFKRAKAAEQRVTEALSNVPRITNETVAEHREEVLSSARKYIYPLQHSKHRVVKTSIALLVSVVIIFLAYCGLSLYRFQSTSGFIYDVTRVLPFPAAKAGKSWVSYESYLFELRRNMHYYQTQQQANFTTKDGKVQLARLKHQAMNQVVADAYVKQLAKKNDVTVSQAAVDNQVRLVRNENRLGNSDRVFKEVLNEFWGWDEGDFKRELRQQLLQQDVVAKLDTATDARAQAALQKIKSGADFAAVAKDASDDVATKSLGGVFPAPITVNDRNISPTLTAEIFKLKPNETSGVINSGYTLEIVKIIDATASSRHVAHIQFTFKDITTYINPIQSKEPSKTYIKV